MTLKEDMLGYLRNKSPFQEMEESEFQFTAEAAIYWFANDYHGGQASELYSILSTSEYCPGPMVNCIMDEDELTQQAYEDLVCVFNVG